MGVTPVTVLAGPAGAASAWLAAWQLDPRFAGTLVVRDGGAVPPEGTCPCCAANDGLTRELRGLHHARAAGAASFDRVVIDTTGGDPRPALAALARTPLASMRFGLSSILATDTQVLRGCPPPGGRSGALGLPRPGTAPLVLRLQGVLAARRET